MKVGFFQKLLWLACLITLAVCGGCLFFLSRKQWSGLCVGCLLVVGNLLLWHWLLSTILPTRQNSATENARFGAIKLLLIGQIKLIVIGALVVVAKKIADVDLKYVLAGLFLLPLSVVATLGWIPLEQKLTQKLVRESANG